MSGIVGIFYRDGKSADPDLIKKMNDRIVHRGPDGNNLLCEGPIAFGHQMLHTTPESLQEELPFMDEDSGLVITSDARIDNREELSKHLRLENNEHVPDSLFILKAYEKWGDSCPEKLLGDFVFVIWDPDKEQLFCARDHMGVKPFYYYKSEDVFLFASEIKAFYNILPCELNELKIAHFLAQIYFDKEITFYKNIFRLPASYSLNLSSVGSSLKQYWALDPSYEIHFESDEDYINAFSDLFKETVRCRLRSSFPIGSMLSGGLDSSYVTCVAQKILKKEGKKNLNTFSAIFDTVPNSNERNYIEKILSIDNFESHFLNADKISPLNDIDNILFYLEEPAIAPNSFMSWNIYQEASKNGSKILLDGLEGDITLSHGNGFFEELARDNKWKKLLREINYKSKRLGANPYKDFLEICLINFTPKFIKRKIFRAREINQKYRSSSRIVKKEFAERMHLFETIAKSYEDNLKINTAHKKHYFDLNSGFIQYELELVDRMSAPFSIEVRHPFFDKRLVEFCLAIPTEQKFSKGWDRLIMRRAMDGIIPIEVQWLNRKTKLSHNFNQSLIKYEKELLDKTIRKSNIIEDYVNTKKLHEIYNQYQTGNVKDLIYLWDATILSIWLQKNAL